MNRPPWKALLLLPALIVSGCARLPINQSPMIALITPDVINRHLDQAVATAQEPKRAINEDRLIVYFPTVCKIEVTEAGGLLTARMVANDRVLRERARERIVGRLHGGKPDITPEDSGSASDFSTRLSNDDETRYPKIGSQALIRRFAGETVMFTTSDGKYDLRIAPIDYPLAVDAVGIARELSDKYDRYVRSLEKQ